MPQVMGQPTLLTVGHSLFKDITWRTSDGEANLDAGELQYSPLRGRVDCAMSPVATHLLHRLLRRGYHS